MQALSNYQPQATRFGHYGTHAAQAEHNGVTGLSGLDLDSLAASFLSPQQEPSVDVFQYRQPVENESNPFQLHDTKMGFFTKLMLLAGGFFGARHISKRLGYNGIISMVRGLVSNGWGAISKILSGGLSKVGAAAK